MKRFALILALILCFSAAIPAAAQTLATLDEFISRYNECMDVLEYEEYYGVDAKLARSGVEIKSGEENDTATVSFPDYPNGFFTLIFDKGSKNITTITAMFESRGASKQPKRLLEFMCALSYCGGAINDPDGVNRVMYNMGMYDQNAFAQGESGLFEGNGRNVMYESTTISGYELIYAYVL